MLKLPVAVLTGLAFLNLPSLAQEPHVQPKPNAHRVISVNDDPEIQDLVQAWREIQTAFKKLRDDAGQPGLAPQAQTDLRNQAQAKLVELQEQEQKILRLYEIRQKQQNAARPAAEKGEDRGVVENIRVQQLLKKADALNQAGRFAEAVDQLEAGLAELTLPSAQSQVLHHIGMHYYRKNNFAKASPFMPDQALDLLGSLPLKESTDKSLLFSAHFNYACAYSLKQEVKKSLAHLGLAAGFDPENTLASLSDSHLDNIRGTAKFKQTEKALSDAIKHP